MWIFRLRQCRHKHSSWALFPEPLRDSSLVLSTMTTRTFNYDQLFWSAICIYRCPVPIIVDVRISIPVQTCIPKSVVPWTASLLVWSEKTTHKKTNHKTQTNKNTHAQTELQPQTKLTHEQRSQNQVWLSTLHRSCISLLLACVHRFSLEPIPDCWLATSSTSSYTNVRQPCTPHAMRLRQRSPWLLHPPTHLPKCWRLHEINVYLW